MRLNTWKRHIEKATDPEDLANWRRIWRLVGSQEAFVGIANSTSGPPIIVGKYATANQYFGMDGAKWCVFDRPFMRHMFPAEGAEVYRTDDIAVAAHICAIGTLPEEGQ